MRYTVTALLVRMVVTCYYIRAVNSKQNLSPDPNSKFCDFPNLEAQILPKLRIFLAKLFSCDQKFSYTMQTQPHTVP